MKCYIIDLKEFDATFKWPSIILLEPHTTFWSHPSRTFSHLIRKLGYYFVMDIRRRSATILFKSQIHRYQCIQCSLQDKQETCNIRINSCKDTSLLRMFINQYKFLLQSKIFKFKVLVNINNIFSCEVRFSC